MCAGLVGGEPGLQPVIGLQVEFGNGIALLARDQIDLRQKLALSRALSVEVPATCLSLDICSLQEQLKHIAGVCLPLPGEEPHWHAFPSISYLPVY